MTLPYSPARAGGLGFPPTLRREDAFCLALPSQFSAGQPNGNPETGATSACGNPDNGEPMVVDDDATDTRADVRQVPQTMARLHGGMAATRGTGGQPRKAVNKFITDARRTALWQGLLTEADTVLPAVTQILAGLGAAGLTPASLAALLAALRNMLVMINTPGSVFTTLLIDLDSMPQTQQTADRMMVLTIADMLERIDLFEHRSHAIPPAVTVGRAALV